MHKILSVEGVNGVGKTHFTKQFSQIYNFFRIKELADEKNEEQQYPKFKTDRTSIKEDIGWFVKQELIRMNKSQQALQNSSVITDRGIISIAAFSYARNRKYKTKEDNLLFKELDEIENNYSKIPWTVIIVLKEPWNKHKEILSKRAKIQQSEINSSLTEPYDYEFYLYLTEYYNLLAEKRPNSILTIDRNTDTSDNYKTVFQWLNKKKSQWSDMNLKDIIISSD
ncbi:MAG: deoxynucleoside kinase [Nanoarchaeota archaeon]|nr:deoxynucleoside kinase [Nanoarchaeota archaeon]